MALLKPEFLRAHPIQAGLIWSAGFLVLFPAIMWLMGSPIPFSMSFVLIVLVGGLAWGLFMKFYHDWRNR